MNQMGNKNNKNSSNFLVLGLQAAAPTGTWGTSDHRRRRRWLPDRATPRPNGIDIPFARNW